MPDEWKRLEIWRLARQPSADQKEKYKRVWECRYVKPDGRLPDPVPAAPGARPTGDKERLDLQYGDGMVVFRYDTEDKTRSCRIPRKAIGDTGSIFIYESMEGKFGWQRVIKSWGATGPPAKLKPSLDKTPVAWVDGKYRDLLCTSTNLGKRDDLDEFRCLYIDPEKGLVEVEEEVKSWLIEEADRELKKEKLLESLLETLKKKAEENDDEGLLDSAREVIDKLMENAVPDVSGGTATPIIITNFITTAIATAAIAGQDWTTGYNASVAAAAAGGPQGALELVSVGWQVVIYSAAIHRLRKKKGKLSQEEDAQLKRYAKTLKDLLIARAPVAIADGINGSISAVAAHNYSTATITSATVDPTGIGGTVAGAGAFGAALSIAVNTYIAARNFRQVHKSRMRRKNFKKQEKIVEELICRLNEQGEYEVDYDATEAATNLQAMTLYVSNKLGRRVARKGATGGVAIASGVAGGAGLLAALAALGVIGLANIWNPLGWALGAVAIVGGVAVAGYMLHRRRTRKDRHKKKRAQGKIASPEEFATKLISFWLETKKTGDQKLLTEATTLMEVFVDTSKVDVEKNPTFAQSEIARHFK